MTIRRALLSVSDKTGLLPFAQALARHGVELLSTGGTARTLREAGLTVIEVSDYTGFPEMMDGRIKTLHPKVHGGLLARRDDASHLQAAEQHGIGLIDLLVVNLYPFSATVARPDCSYGEAIENIDIGGPAMLRAAAKNHGSSQGGVTVVVDPTDYPRVLQEMQSQGGATSHALRLELATKVYAHTAAYDGAIANWLSSLQQTPETVHAVPDRDPWPRILTVQWHQVQSLRYGENPHQTAAFYKDAQIPAGSLAAAKQLQGKELSYNNIADADAAWNAVRGFAHTACVIVKHANPCGVALGETALQAYERAFKTDSTSAFGGIIAFNRPLDAQTAQAVSRQFVEVLMAPGFSAEALEIFASKPNVRLLEVPMGHEWSKLDSKRVGGGWLVQSPDATTVTRDQMRVVTQKAPTEAQWQDLLFVWEVARHVKSNAIVYGGDGMTLGVGAGQMSRIDSARIAAIKAGHAGLSLLGCAAASDAFFPFRDGLDVLAEAGASCVIQPGGSMRDEEVIAAANEHGIAMVFTGMRHFRH